LNLIKTQITQYDSQQRNILIIKDYISYLSYLSFSERCREVKDTRIYNDVEAVTEYVTFQNTPPSAYELLVPYNQKMLKRHMVR
jgi:hypothetical protein